MCAHFLFGFETIGAANIPLQERSINIFGANFLNLLFLLLLVDA